MKFERRQTLRLLLIAGITTSLTLGSTRLHADTGTCGGQGAIVPFNDVMSSIFFCQIAEAYFSGLTNGTTPTTYSPLAIVTRDQMAAFITRTQDSALRRGSKRAVFDQFWTTTPRYVSSAGGLGTTAVGLTPELVQSDGSDLWVPSFIGNTVSQVRASDGKLLNTWTSAANGFGVLAFMGRVFVTGDTTPTGKLYMINPSQGGSTASLIAQVLGPLPHGITSDGDKLWTANLGGSVSIITPGSSTPWSVTNVTAGFSQPVGILFDGSNIWVTDIGTNANSLYKLDSNGAILQTVSVGSGPLYPAFDGTNIWVPNNGNNTLTVVRASTGAIVATLNSNGLVGPEQVAFDGQRILVTNRLGDSVSLWKADDLTPLGSFSTGSGTSPNGACSDGLNFWLTLGTNQLARF